MKPEIYGRHPDAPNPPFALRQKLEQYAWRPNNLVDLHSLGIHYHDEQYLPVHIDPMTYLAYVRAGMCPPVSLPTYFPEDTQARVKKFLDLNYFKLSMGGVQYLGNEFNVQPESDWEKAKTKVCIVRLTPYNTVDGAFGHFLIGNFVNDFYDDIFIDFAFAPEEGDDIKLMDAGLPLLFGNITKRPLTDFDVVIFSNCYPQERMNIPFMLIKSGIPLYRWQRWDHSLPYYQKMPIIAVAGIGAYFIEGTMADHPIKGVGENAMHDIALIGEGEMLDLKVFQQFEHLVYQDGKTKEEFLASLHNPHFQGVYDPRNVLWEYNDKVHTQVDHKGNQIGEPTVYPGGGSIKRVSLLDHENQERHVLAGSGSDEFKQLEASNINYIDNIRTMPDPSVLADKYVKPDAVETRKKRFISIKQVD